MNARSDAPPRLRILVTGAAGLVGRELCGVLAARGHAVVGLVHRSRTLERNDGSPVPTKPYDDAMKAGVVALLGGDVAARHFGLDEAAARTLAASLDLVVHCAALTGFSLPEETYERVNVGGTANAIAFAGAAAARTLKLLYVSTAYVCGVAHGVVAEAPATGTEFNNGYERSKAAAERLVFDAHARGQPVAVARPSIVTGSADTGAIGAFGNLYHYVRLVAEGRTGVLPAEAGASMNLVPIDHVVAGLVDIAERMAEADGRVFHLAADAPVELASLEALGREFPHLAPPRFVPLERFDPVLLSPRQAALHAQVTAPFAPYLRPSPRFATANLRALSGRGCPPTDTAYLRRMIGFAMAAGFLPAGSDAKPG